MPRFHIEDLLAQGPFGVWYRALDGQTGGAVALHRFFPFGVEGGGLDADRQAAYGGMIAALAGFHHPALRAVVGGGCDPVDGMPFIAHAWVEGEVLAASLAEAPLGPDEVVTLLERLLEACERLSEWFGVEQVWVESSAADIILPTGGLVGEARFVFAPRSWLDGAEPRGLGSLVALVEELTGWAGLAVADSAGKGLGAWLRWLRQHAAHASLHEARAALAQREAVDPAAVPAVPGPPPPAQVVQARARPVVRSAPPRKRSKAPLLAVLSLIAVGGLAAWFFTLGPGARAGRAGLGSARFGKVGAAPKAEQAEKVDETALSLPPPTPVASSAQAPSGGAPDLEAIKRRAAELTRLAAEGQPTAPGGDPVALDAQKAAIAARGGLFHPGDVESLTEQVGKPVQLEGTLADFDVSNTGKTLYLVFDDPHPWAARGEIVLSKAGEGLSRPELEALKGRKLRLSGTVDLQGLRGGKRPLVNISRRDQIEAAD